MRGRLGAVVLVGIVGAIGVVAGWAQEKGNWRPMSSTAKAITGEVTISGEKLVMNFAGFPMAQIRVLKPEEIGAVFSNESGAAGGGSLYRLSIPAAKVFLHHNTLCGAEDTQWMVTDGSGRTLQVAFFSGAQMPVFTSEAISNSTNLCGTFSYAR